MIHQSLRILPLWYQIIRKLHHFKVDILQKLVACGLSNMRSDHQNSMKSSSRQISKATLIWTSGTSTTTSTCVLMRWLDSDKTFLLINSPSKDNLILGNTLYQICDKPHYSWNDQIYNSLGHSLLVSMINDTCVKYFIASQAYRILYTHTYEI